MDKIITELNKNKAIVLDNLTAELLQFSHPIVVTIMFKIFNIMMSYDYFPASFAIPLPKGNDIFDKALMADDFRGICIFSRILQKIVEQCILYRFPYHIFNLL